MNAQAMLTAFLSGLVMWLCYRQGNLEQEIKSLRKLVLMQMQKDPPSAFIPNQKGPF